MTSVDEFLQGYPFPDTVTRPGAGEFRRMPPIAEGGWPEPMAPRVAPTWSAPQHLMAAIVGALSWWYGSGTSTYPVAYKRGTFVRDEEDALSVGDLPHTVWLAQLPGVVADLSHSSVSCSTGEVLAGRSGS